ncbi:MAG: hypothetical protein Q4D51_00875 [Eubacteriales bacterium]|nr:hypothetical protein [Eubacteriales bacterium]
MFSQNGKLSEKQLRRMLILPLYASLILVVPHVSAWLFGASIVPGLLAFFVMSLLYVAFIWWVARWYQNNRLCVVQNRLLLLIQIVRLIVRLAFYIGLTIAVLGEGEVPFAPQNTKQNAGGLLVAVPLLAICVYAAWQKREQQGRIYELMFWLLFVPFIFVVLFGIRRMDFSVFVPHCDVSFGILCYRAYLLLPFLLPVENYLLLRPYLQSGEKSRKTCYAIMGTIFLAVLLTLGILGIYGVQAGGAEELLTVAIMRCIRLPFQLTERVDAFLIWFFLVGCFVLIAQTLFFAAELVAVSIRGAKRIWSIVVILGSAIVVVIFLPDYSSMLWSYRTYAAIMDVPLSLILPMVGMLGKGESAHA